MNQLKLIQPAWPAPVNIRAVSTTRVSGHSLGVYGAFNLGAHVGDNAASVALNRTELTSQLGLTTQVNWLNQTHSTDIINLDQVSNIDHDGQLSADAAITSTPDRPCIVMTADCLPILLANKQGTQVAAVHAGWRGLANGIIEAAVRAFDVAPAELLTWCGPCIGPEAFEVGIEVRDKLGGPESAYRPHSDESKVYADLHHLAEARLLQMGVVDNYFSEQCTYSEPEQFFSYRRDGQTGRMATLIWIDKNEV